MSLFEDWDFSDKKYYSIPDWKLRKIKSNNPDLTKHYPNQNEARVLRKLMSQTGMNEEEIRSHKKYRVMLSEAQKLKGKGQSDAMKYGKMLLKDVLRELKLPKEHPLVLQKLKEAIEKKMKYWNWIEFIHVRPKDIIQNYKRK